jgi:bifunctional non-homologous end joining protein LigD
MTLRLYRKKRDVKESREPLGKTVKSKKNKTLTFVVQKHDARNLHYDFRLECEGVLKSWAVPKGPSLDPKVKRLAIEVEDHPLEYGKFEGIIPQGNYGAGTVEIWDKGTYVPLGDFENHEKYIKTGIAKGEIKFILSGEKLKGEFVLVRIKNDSKQHQWLLIKHKDDYSAKENDSPKNPTKKASKNVKAQSSSKMPHHIKPMLSTLVEEPFDNSDWIFEIKWDGYRAISEVNGKNIELYSRNLLSFKTHFPTITHELQNMKENVILDGEIVALDKKGLPSFQLLQQYLKTGKGDIRYYIFDLLFIENKDLKETPLLERKKLLKDFLKKINQPSLLFCDHVIFTGKKFFKECKKLGLEGIMAKKKDSIYRSERTKDWLKIKNQQSHEAIIIGFTEPKGSRSKFGSLLLAIRKNKKLKFAGHVGTGFDEKTLQGIFQILKPLVIKKCPLDEEPKTNTQAIWVKPSVVCEVTFTEWTDDHRLRHPVFKGIRSDKTSKEVIMEKPETTPKTKKTSDVIASKKGTDNFLTHLDKIYWKKMKYTKGDLIEYYSEIAPFILPYLKNRPIVMHRFPDGIDGQDFYHKEAPDFIPEWIKTTSVEHSAKNMNYMMIQDKPSLLYVANLGSIEMHPFSSTISHLEMPDYIILDLDPQEVSFKQVVLVAKTLHEVMDEIGVPNFCKTSGKRGLHIYIPLGGKYSYEQAQNFAEIIARVVNQKLPKITSLIRSPEKRKKKIYIDYLQNSRTKTVVSPYSVRPTPDATVSTPLDWSEVNESLDPKKFTIKTMAQRLKTKGDLFKSLDSKKANIKTAIAKLEKLLS